MLERILGVIAIGTLAAGVAFGGYQYKEVHLPEFAELQATVKYQECIRQCQETCQANGIPIDQCNCGHCQVHRPS